MFNQFCKIPGAGILTIMTVLTEINGFDLIRSKKQLRLAMAALMVGKTIGDIDKKQTIKRNRIHSIISITVFPCENLQNFRHVFNRRGYLKTSLKVYRIYSWR